MKTEFFINNRKRYLEKAADNSLTLLYSGRFVQKSYDQDYPFEVNKDFYYLAGINQANVILALVKSGGEGRATLFIEENDPVLSKWVGSKLTIDEARSLSGIEDVRYLDAFERFTFALFNPMRFSAGRIGTLLLDLERVDLPGYTNWALEYATEFAKKYPEVDIRNARETILGLRMVKTEEEVAAIKDAIAMTKKGIEAIMKAARAGLYEYQLDACFDFALKNGENYDLAFETIVAAGKNATILHYVAKRDLIGADDLVLLDLGARSGFHVSDITRTIPVSGRFTARQKEVYAAVLEVNKKCIEFLKPGLTWKDMNEYARELLGAAVKKLGLAGELDKYYYHSIGHFIGLDTHDPGVADAKFEPGMTLTIEPGLYIEEEGIGIRIEDNCLITASGAVNLSKDIIKEIDEIEKFMAAAH
ncbi:MAG TPA: M24 family metallopeptidase [Acholeplasmataceae bacterium]|jgi:Xaa-Pro aminopeptidase|nr:M24 family metallopeptidase [Acholeplasmataceae bacterium]